jgi:hypothetical protein
MGMMLCDISVVFNSFAYVFGLMSRKRSSESRQVLVTLQSRESFGRLQYAGGGTLMREYLVDPQRVYIDGGVWYPSGRPRQGTNRMSRFEGGLHGFCPIPLLAPMIRTATPVNALVGPATAP